MNTRHDPSVSVVIPTYNCADLLPRAIASAFDQTVPPVEVIVVNDGCTDDTDAVMRQLVDETSKNLRYVVKENGGEASARNTGVAHATGEFVAFIDQDDVWLPDKLETQLRL